MGNKSNTKDKKSNNLGKDTIKLTFSKFLTLAITTVTGMILVRIRTLEEYGTYSAMLLVINLISALIMLGLPNCINYFIARAETSEEKKHFLSVYYTLSTVLSGCVGLVLILSIPLIELYFKNQYIGKFYYFLAIYPWASTIITSIDNVLVVYKKTNLLIIYKFLYGLANLITILVIQWLGYGFTTYMISMVIMNSVFAVITYIICAFISKGLMPSFDKKIIKKIFIYSIPIGLATLVGTLSIEIDKLLIGYVADSEQLAIYSNAAKELPLTIVATSITAVLLPHIAIMIKNNKTNYAVKLWGDSIILSYVIISLLVAGIFIYAEDVMTLLYSEKYLSGINVFRIYTLTLLIRCTYYGMILSSVGQTTKIFICSIANLVLNAILNPIFYLIWGIEGPALATLVSLVISSFIQLILTSKVTHISIKEIFPWVKILQITFINLPFIVAFWLLKKMLPIDLYIGSLGESLLLGGVWSILYFILLKDLILKCWNKINSTKPYFENEYALF